MNNSDDVILSDLDIIGKILPNNKLCYRGGVITLEDYTTDVGIRKTIVGLKNTLKRWYHQDNRHNTYLYVQNVILQAFTRCHSILNNENTQDKWILSMYITKLEKCIQGITNLAQTYESDAKFCSKIELLQQHIKQQLTIFQGK